MNQLGPQAATSGLKGRISGASDAVNPASVLKDAAIIMPNTFVTPLSSILPVIPASAEIYHAPSPGQPPVNPISGNINPRFRGDDNQGGQYSRRGDDKRTWGSVSMASRMQALSVAALTAVFSCTPVFAASHGAEGVSPFLFEFSIFVLAIFVGYYVVWSVTPALHTPLMSVTNAISSVIVVGALLAVTVEAADALFSSSGAYAKVFGFLALVMASINIFGGFLVTSRMLSMYKKKDK